MERNIQETIAEELQDNEALAKLCTHSLCRLWTRAVMLYLKKYPEIKTEAREVKINDSLDHTFLRITVGDQKPYFIDGMGVEKNPPYFGPEDEAPQHLLNSRPDTINLDFN
ncbi:MAG TPA: hypothetical protein VMR19_00875 [Candidatus Saccharimonadales bacterium]|jgi:hypothetical protein|nr:hypothetical protein [Candidatus Saccharimonadales bacterium]